MCSDAPNAEGESLLKTYFFMPVSFQQKKSSSIEIIGKDMSECLICRYNMCFRFFFISVLAECLYDLLLAY